MLEEPAPASRGEALAPAFEAGRRLRRPQLPPLPDALAAHAELARDLGEADAWPGEALEQPRMCVAPVAIVEGGDLSIARGQE